jgi:hypothetical protein
MYREAAVSAGRESAKEDHYQAAKNVILRTPIIEGDEESWSPYGRETDRRLKIGDLAR